MPCRTLRLLAAADLLAAAAAATSPPPITTTTLAAADAVSTAASSASTTEYAGPPPRDRESESGGGQVPSAEDVSDADSDSNSAECFPAAATVTLRSGAVARMDALSVGDAVAVGGGAFSPVFMFTHRDAGAVSRFVRLTTAANATLEATPGHYLHTPAGLSRADALRVGDELFVRDAPAAVVRVEVVVRRGLYNPQTLHGSLLVDGVLASTYTAALEPAVAHAALAPLRALYRMAGREIALIERGGGALGSVLPGAPVVA